MKIYRVIQHIKDEPGCLFWDQYFVYIDEAKAKYESLKNAESKELGKIQWFSINVNVESEKLIREFSDKK